MFIIYSIPFFIISAILIIIFDELLNTLWYSGLVGLTSGVLSLVLGMIIEIKIKP